MPAPLGFDHVHDRGPRGMLARWWLRRRTRRIRAALARTNTRR